jgi:tryptophan synthase beta chain
LQCYYNAQAGIKKLTTETGAGQWGTALAFACTLFGMEAEVWQVGSSYDQKPYRRLMMELYGSKVRPWRQLCIATPSLMRQVHRSPSNATDFGKAVLATNPQASFTQRLLNPAPQHHRAQHPLS